jgi:predicted secreted protein
MKAMKTWRPIILGLSLAAGAACAAPALAQASKAIILTEQSTGVAKARVGQAVEIRLRSQPGTGFSWSPKNDAAKLTTLPPIQAQAIPGGWQTQRFRFLAKRAGTYRLTFSYDRPWKGGEKGARTIAFTIKVR